jgi:hypothetical protein
VTFVVMLCGGWYLLWQPSRSSWLVVLCPVVQALVLMMQHYGMCAKHCCSRVQLS